MDNLNSQPINIIDNRIRKIIAEVIRTIRRTQSDSNIITIPRFAHSAGINSTSRNMHNSAYLGRYNTNKNKKNNTQRNIIIFLLLLLLLFGILVWILVPPLTRSKTNTPDPKPMLSADATVLDDTSHRVIVNSTIDDEASPVVWNYEFSNEQIVGITKITINSTLDQLIVNYIPTDVSYVTGTVTINGKWSDELISDDIVIDVLGYFPRGDGTNWIGVEAGGIDVENFDEVNNTCYIGGNTDFLSRDLYIPDFVYKDDDLLKAYKIVGIIEAGFATNNARWPRGVGGLVSFPKYLTHVLADAFNRDYGQWGYTITSVEFNRVEIGRDNIQFANDVFTGNKALAGDSWLVDNGLYR
ncbi:MAG: hypothetical protein LBV22_02555 [Mycoplasmataceae bacterium]|nr:hypothetical protein [Mycoplasmataceae bacterium]